MNASATKYAPKATGRDGKAGAGDTAQELTGIDLDLPPSSA